MCKNSSIKTDATAGGRPESTTRGSKKTDVGGRPGSDVGRVLRRKTSEANVVARTATANSLVESQRNLGTVCRVIQGKLEGVAMVTSRGVRYKGDPIRILGYVYDTGILSRIEYHPFGRSNREPGHRRG